MRVVNKVAFLGCIFCVFLSSCNKDEDETPPSITITSPTGIPMYDVYDVVDVTATITDNNVIQTVKVDIVNSDFVPVIGSVTFVVNAASYSLSASMYLDNTHIESGTHYIKITASDGNNNELEYHEIYITELPLERNGVLMVSSTGGVVDINVADDVYSVSSFYSEARDYSDAAINSYDQYLMLAGSFNDNCKAITLDFQQMIFALPSENTWPDPYFYEINYSVDKNLTFVSTADNSETIKGYNRYGSIAASMVPFSGHRPHFVLAHEGYVLIEQEEVLGTDVEMVVYYATTGSVKQSLQMNRDVVAMFAYDDDNALVFGNQAGQAILSMYVINSIPSGNYFWEPTIPPAGQFIDAVQLTSQLYGVSHDNGIYIYDHTTQNFSLIVAGVVANDVEFDFVNNVILAAVGTDMHVYDLSGSLVTTVPNGSAISKILVWYNK